MINIAHWFSTSSSFSCYKLLDCGLLAIAKPFLTFLTVSSIKKALLAMMMLSRFKYFGPFAKEQSPFFLLVEKVTCNIYLALWPPEQMLSSEYTSITTGFIRFSGTILTDPLWLHSIHPKALLHDLPNSLHFDKKHTQLWLVNVFQKVFFF